MKVAIISQKHTPNIGDIAIGAVEKKRFTDKGAEVEELEFWNSEHIIPRINNALLSRIVWHTPFMIDLLVRQWIKKTVSAQYDAVIIGGGELLSEHKGFNSALLGWVSFFRKNKTAVYVYGVSGSSRLKSSLIRRNQKALKMCNGVYARDHESQRTIQNKYGCNCGFFPDVVYSLGMMSTKKENRDSLLVIPVPFERGMKESIGVTDCDEYAEYLYEYAKMQGANEISFTVTEQRDEEQVKGLVNRINLTHPMFCKYINYNGLQCFCDLLAKVDIVISARMHALILGQLYGCRSKVIPYKEKLRVFEQENLSLNVINLISQSEAGLDHLEQLVLKNTGKNN